MHWQTKPHEEAKLVRCSQGALFDIILDLRKDSPTFGQWFGCELTARGDRMMYVPEGVAHGFITLADNTEITYFISSPYAPQSQKGVRWNDPAFNIRLPIAVEVISERDKNYPLWEVVL